MPSILLNSTQCVGSETKQKKKNTRNRVQHKPQQQEADNLAENVRI